jgi:hypothetical protein
MQDPYKIRMRTADDQKIINILKKINARIHDKGNHGPTPGSPHEQMEQVDPSKKSPLSPID